MDIRVVEVRKMSRAIALLASLDPSQFTKEQQEIISEGVQAVAIAEEYRKTRADRNREFLRKKRAEIPGYNYPKHEKTGNPMGRPKKQK